MGYVVLTRKAGRYPFHCQSPSARHRDRRGDRLSHAIDSSMLGRYERWFARLVVPSRNWLELGRPRLSNWGNGVEGVDTCLCLLMEDSSLQSSVWLYAASTFCPVWECSRPHLR